LSPGTGEISGGFLIMRKLLTMISVLFVAGLFNGLSAQTAVDKVFQDVEEMIKTAREEGAEWLSPDFYRNSVENFEKANKYRVNNESSRDIREKLTAAKDYCVRAQEVVKLGRMTLSDAINARMAAIEVDAGTYAEELFRDAENRFRDAALEVEDGDLDDAREVGAEAEAAFRKAELKAIKDKILSDARRLVAEAEEIDAIDYAPLSFGTARTMLNDVEELLKNNRYATKEASEKARETVYQANHAIYLTNEIKALREDEMNWEKLIVQFEDIVSGLSSQFDDRPRFDTGFKEPVNTLMTRIQKLKKDYKGLLEENARLEEELNKVQEQATTSSAELAEKKLREEKIERIKALFNPSEAKVVFDGDNLVIRLYGLNFPPGMSIIEPEYFSLLSKVQESMREFPTRHVLLEGHTDSQGIPTKNKILSEERARAVREYIIANMGINREQITAVGYGDTRPVASNKTVEGRTLNRRIDVVINLGN
jgi:OOP family OmpA-OmpF porin